MIVVTGATGQLGRGVINGLLSRMPAGRIVASVRDPAKAAALAETGVHVRAGDFAEPDGLAAAFAGAAQVLVVSVDKLGETASASSCRDQGRSRRRSAARALHQPHGRASGLALRAGRGSRRNRGGPG